MQESSRTNIPTSHTTSSFGSLGISPNLLKIVDTLKFRVPTPIQFKAIPIAVEGKDIIGIAQTGTGKTLAFAIPMVQRLSQGKGRGLVLVPTRELALQVDETFQKIAHPSGIKTTVLIGGASMSNQIQSLKKNPRVLIATPGRLIDHLEERRVQLLDVSVLVLDEADRMLDMGFAPQIERIMRSVQKDRQTLLFSATMPAGIVRIASSYMKLPINVEIAASGTAAERVSPGVFIIRKDAKAALLEKLLAQYHGPTLLFARTKISAEKITRRLKASGHRAAEIHSDRSLGQRREALDGFKSGKYRILVATDIAARGIDVTGIEVVINYDIPDDTENYIHRIGRTGRAGHAGHAVSFATPDQRNEIKRIETLMKTVIPISQHPDIPSERFQEPQTVFRSSSRSRRGGGGRSKSRRFY